MSTNWKLTFSVFFIFLYGHASSQSVDMSIARVDWLLDGIENIVHIRVDGIPDSSISVRYSNGEIKRESRGIYRLKVKRKDGRSTIFVNKIVGLDTILIDERFIPIRRVSKLCKAHVGFKNELSRDELLAYHRLNTYVDGLDICTTFPIESFTTLIIRENRPIVFLRTKGCNFDDALLERFRFLQSNDIVRFLDIKATDSDGTTFDIPSFKIKIINER